PFASANGEAEGSVASARTHCSPRSSWRRRTALASSAPADAARAAPFASGLSVSNDIAPNHSRSPVRAPAQSPLAALQFEGADIVALVVRSDSYHCSKTDS